MGVPVDSTRWGVSDAGCAFELTREQRMGLLGNAFDPRGVYTFLTPALAELVALLAAVQG